MNRVSFLILSFRDLNVNYLHVCVMNVNLIVLSETRHGRLCIDRFNNSVYKFISRGAHKWSVGAHALSK